MDFEILQPTNVVEASFTDDPFDASKVAIKLEVTFEAGDKADFLLFQIVDPGKREFSLTAAPGPLFSTITDLVSQSDGEPGDGTQVDALQALTTKPEIISPIAVDFGKWTFVKISDGVFKATPKGFTPSAGSSAEFRLYNVDVTTGEGKCGILVSSVLGATQSNRKVLLVRKVNPALRIDEFSADASSVRPPGDVVLRWATTGATTVKLDGVVLETKDGKKTVNPLTTSTYTLTASSGTPGAVTGTVVAQVTVTVTNQIVIGGLTVNARKAAGAATTDPFTRLGVGSALEVDNILTAGGSTAKAGGLIHGDLTVEGTISATGLLGGAAIPAGIIVMWSGKAISNAEGTEVPDIPGGGWHLCNGDIVPRSDGTGRSIKTPNLSGKFIKAVTTPAGTDVQGGGPKAIELANMPVHNHTTPIGGKHPVIVPQGQVGLSGNDTPAAVRLSRVIEDIKDADGNVIEKDHKFSLQLDEGDHGGHSHTTHDAGGALVDGVIKAVPFDIEPSFYTLAFIMKT